MYKTYKKLLGLIVISVLLVASMQITLFAASGVQTKTMKVGESFEIGIDHMWTSNNPDIVKIDYTPCPAFPGSTHDFAVAVAPGKALLTSTSGIMEIIVIPKETPEFKVYGYVNPDFQYPVEKTAVVNYGFKVELLNTDKVAWTYSNGYFQIKNIPANTEGYTIKISKGGYLSREIKIASTKGDCELSTSDAPIKLWGGDLVINGAQDNAVNITDIMELASRFNSSSSDARYSSYNDLNDDGSINIVDIMIIAQYFNRSSEDYPQVQVNYIPASPVPTTSPTVTELPGVG